ncbi:hypothetical protein Tsubulata_023620 [Turnera subulata]|uniref:Uncharacterized protein n=1 Tax=Turnera subulata TaxID=218843 RepID=A0A9Q0FDY4_9ROSI|nr:hypothetical protein Tsubulata_023620 [Turnera subulata]
MGTTVESLTKSSLEVAATRSSTEAMKSLGEIEAAMESAVSLMNSSVEKIEGAMEYLNHIMKGTAPGEIEALESFMMYSSLGYSSLEEMEAVESSKSEEFKAMKSLKSSLKLKSWQYIEAMKSTLDVKAMKSPHHIEAGGQKYMLYFRDVNNWTWGRGDYTVKSIVQEPNKPNPARDVYDFYRCVGGDFMEPFDFDSSDITDFLPLFAQTALDSHSPWGNARLYPLKFWNICNLEEGDTIYIHFNFWATRLPPPHEFDPTQLSIHDPNAIPFYCETKISWPREFVIAQCIKVDDLDKLDRHYGIRGSPLYGTPCSSCAAANPHVLHPEYPRVRSYPRFFDESDPFFSHHKNEKIESAMRTDLVSLKPVIGNNFPFFGHDHSPTVTDTKGEIGAGQC